MHYVAILMLLALCRRNELVALNMIIGAVTASFAFVSMIGGIFGMNLSPLPIETTQVCIIQWP